MPAAHVLRTEGEERGLLREAAAEAARVTGTTRYALNLGVRDHTVGRWLTGERTPPPGFFLAVFDALGAAGQVHLLRALAARAGLRVTVEAAPARRLRSLPEEAAEAHLAGARFGVELAQATADGRIDREEQRRLRTAAAVWVAEVADVDAGLAAPALKRAA